MYPEISINYNLDHFENSTEYYYIKELYFHIWTVLTVKCYYKKTTIQWIILCRMMKLTRKFNTVQAITIPQAECPQWILKANRNLLLSFKTEHTLHIVVMCKNVKLTQTHEQTWDLISLHITTISQYNITALSSQSLSE